MFDNEIMTQGERLKKIRQIILGATQTEIAQDVCTKNMISQIERNKKRLNFNLATKIADNLNAIAKKKGVNLALITPEELMIDNDELASYVFETQILNDLKVIESIDEFDIKLLEAEKLLQKYNITDNKKIDLYKIAADFYYYKHCYSKSDEMCDIGLKISINSLNSFEELNLYICKARANIFGGNHVKALQQLEHAEKLNNHIVNDDFCVMIFYYKALTYKKLGEYDTALKYFKILTRFRIKDFKMLLKIKMVYANCLNDSHKFNEAEKEYKETLNIALKHNESEFISITYRNLSELYFNKKDYKLSAEYAKESLHYSLENEYLNEILYFTAKMLQHINEDSEMYLLQSLEICEKKDRGNLILIEKLIYELVLIYIKREDNENLMLMAHKAKELNIDYSLIYLELTDYYRDRNEEKSKYFNCELKEKLKQIKKISYDNF